MSYFVGTSAHATTGVKTVTVGFQPTGMRITVGQLDGATDTKTEYCVGFTDGTTSYYTTTFRDSTSAKTESDITHLTRVFKRSGGVLVDAIVINLDSFTATQVKYNVTTADVNYTLAIEAWN